MKRKEQILKMRKDEVKMERLRARERIKDRTKK